MSADERDIRDEILGHKRYPVSGTIAEVSVSDQTHLTFCNLLAILEKLEPRSRERVLRASCAFYGLDVHSGG